MIFVIPAKDLVISLPNQGTTPALSLITGVRWKCVKKLSLLIRKTYRCG